MPIPTRRTYEDLREMPDDGRRCELPEGDLAVSPTPKIGDQRIVLNLTDLLRQAEKAGYGAALPAPSDVVLAADTAVQPDLLFVARARRGILHADNVQGPPDLVVEVLSESSRRRDLGPKLCLYARYGVGFYWAADPDEQAVRVYTRLGDGYGEPTFLRLGDSLTCPLFPTVGMAVDDVFAI